MHKCFFFNFLNATYFSINITKPFLPIVSPLKLKMSRESMILLGSLFPPNKLPASWPSPPALWLNLLPPAEPFLLKDRLPLGFFGNLGFFGHLGFFGSLGFLS